MANMFERFKPKHPARQVDDPFYAVVADMPPSEETISFDDFNTTRGDLYNHLIGIACNANQIELPSREQLTELLAPLNIAAGNLFASLLGGEGEFDDKLDLISDIYVTDNNERCEMIERTLQLTATLTYLNQQSMRKRIRELIEEKYGEMSTEEAVSAIYKVALRDDVNIFMRLVSEREQTRALIREEQATARLKQYRDDLAKVAFGAGVALLVRRSFKG